MGETQRTRKAAWLVAAVVSFAAGDALGDEDWEPGDLTKCNFEAWADSADIEWLDKELASQRYQTLAKSNNFDFIGPASEVPYRAGCGQVWVSACQNQPNANHWLKLKDGTCTATQTDAETATNTSTSVSAPRDEPAGGSCGPLEPEPAQPGEVNSRMRTAAEGLLPLSDDYHRQNHALEDGDAEPGVADSHGGEELSKEIEGWKDHPQTDKATIMRHYEQTAGRPWREVSRAAVAVVAHEGFSRDITALYQVIRVHDDGHFHNDAEGLNLVEKRAAEKEREMQLALADGLAQVEQRLRADKIVDHQSISLTEAYRQLALLRARNLASVACQLGTLAAIDADRERRMHSLGFGAASGIGGGDPPGTATSKRESDVSGRTTITMGNTAINEETKTSTGTETGTSTSTDRITDNDPDGLLRAFGPGDPPRRALAEIGEGDLFERVHRQMRGREATGAFRGVIVEEDPIQLP